MKPRLPAFAVLLALGLATVAGPAFGEDLLQIYREALRADPAIAAAKANWEAAQEKAPQARAGSAAAGLGCRPAASFYNYDATIKSEPREISTAISTSTTQSYRRRSRCSVNRI